MTCVTVSLADYRLSAPANDCIAGGGVVIPFRPVPDLSGAALKDAEGALTGAQRRQQRARRALAQGTMRAFPPVVLQELKMDEFESRVSAALARARLRRVRLNRSSRGVA